MSILLRFFSNSYGILVTSLANRLAPTLPFDSCKLKEGDKTKSKRMDVFAKTDEEGGNCTWPEEKASKAPCPRRYVARVPGPGRRLLDREEGGNEGVVQCGQGVSSHLPKSS